jgi:hypothetical protein
MIVVENEIWKPIQDYIGLYEISNIGRVKSLKRIKNGKGNSKIEVNERILSPYIKEKKYIIIHLCKNGKVKAFTIHRLVAIHFVNNPENKSIINHKDCNKHNNSWDNLEWVTSSENIKHAWDNGIYTDRFLITRSANEKCKKPVICVQTEEIFESASEAGRRKNICKSSIIANCRNKRKSAGKINNTPLTWRYLNE